MSKVEYYVESDEENENIAVERLEPGEYLDYDDDLGEEGETLVEEQEKPVVVAVPPKKTGTIILKPGTITLPVKKKQLTPIHDKQKVREVLEKLKSKTLKLPPKVSKTSVPLENPEKQITIEVVNEDALNDSSVSGSSIIDRFLHRKRVMALEAEKTGQSSSPEPKKFRVDSESEPYNGCDFFDSKKIYWNSEKDLKNLDSTMYDTDMLKVIVRNQFIMDTKLNLLYKNILKAGISRSTIVDDDDDFQTPESNRYQFEKPSIVQKIKSNTAEQITFHQIPIRNSDEFLSLEEELKTSVDSMERFETMLEHLGSPDNYSELIKRITGKLFTPNFMEQLGWSQVGTCGLHLKDSVMRDSIYKVFVKKYDGLQQEMLNEKFSQHFRSFRLHRNKSRSKRKEKCESSS